MQPIIPVLVASALALASALASAQQRPPPADVPPPPGMSDPAATASMAPVTPIADGQAQPATDAADPLAAVPKPDARLVRDKASRDAASNSERMAASQLTRRQQGNDTVEEYRQNGRIWMIRIVPINGPIQTFVTNDGSGRLVRDPKEGPVSPVYYTLYEWK